MESQSASAVAMDRSGIPVHNSPGALQPGINIKNMTSGSNLHPLLGIASIDALGLGITWRNTLDAARLLAMAGHPMPLPTDFPAAGYVKVVNEAATSFVGSRILRNFELDDFHLQNHICLQNDHDKIHLVLELQSTGSHERHGDRTDFVSFRIRSHHEDLDGSGNTSSPVLNALGCIRLRSSKAPQSLSSTLSTVKDNPVLVRTLPMSYGQSGFWFMTQLIDDPTFFNGTVSFLITDITLDIAHLAQIVLDMAQQHEGLRTAFFADPQTHKPVQAVLSSSPLRLETKTITFPSQVRAEIDAMNKHVYDISKGETLRLLLLTESPTINHLIVGYHHINIDGMSIIALTDHLRLAYKSPAPLPAPFQHPDFALLQHKRLQSGQYDADIAYWKSEFHAPALPDILPILPLSPSTALKSRPSTRTTYRHVRAERRLSTSTTAALHALRKTGKIQSPFIFYTTVFQILLARLAQTDDLVIGLASANRHNDPSSTDSIGIFLNLIALRLRADMSEHTFASLLSQNKAKIIQGLKHSSVPIDVVLEEVNAPRHASYNPLFQAFVNYIPVPETRTFGEGIIQNKEYEIGETMYDIMLAVIDPPAAPGSSSTGNNPWIAIMLQQELYTQEEARLLLDCFVNLVEAFVEDVHVPATRPQMFSPLEVARAVELGRGEGLDFAGGLGSILGRLDAGGRDRDGQVALRDTRGCVLTYGDMMARSIQIAIGLSAARIAPRSRIGVLQEPTVDWVCSMLGIWRFGASYVPLEVTQGVGRLRTMVKDADLAAVLVHSQTRGLCDEIGLDSRTVVLHVGSLTTSHTEMMPGFYQPMAEDEAIVLYTSGSTGVPKAISLPHRMITNTILGYLHSFPMTPQIVLQQIALSFDVSWWQTLIGLATGGSVVVAGKEVRRDPFALTGLIISEGITLTLAVPSEATSWLQNGNLEELRGSAWEWHISAGEEIGANLIEGLRALQKPDLRLVNAYGPAETIIPHAYAVPYRDIHLHQPIPIGKVLPNYSVYIMDQDLHPVPAGVPGQIVIAGAGVASGYINQPDLTASRFPHDYLASPRAAANGWTKMHLSGDRGYMDEHGIFTALGRMNGDTQVKLRGQRFELREVESAMVNAGKGDILEAVCHVRRQDERDAGSAFLVAHVVLGPGVLKTYGGTTGPAVDNMLRKTVSDLALPQYMRPSAVVPLPSMPLSHHGKVDRKLLANLPLREIPRRAGNASQGLQKITPTPLPSEETISKTGHSIPPPRGNVSRASLRLMEGIWREVLGDLVHPDQKLEPGIDFFLAGGSSLLLINVKGRIRERTGYDVPLARLFEESTLERMASTLENLGDNQPPSRQDLPKNPQEAQQPVRGGLGTLDKMKKIWLSVLGNIVSSEQDVGPESDFFLVGGSSLLLIGVQREVNKEFGVPLPLAKLFETSTLGQMAAFLDAALAARQNDILIGNGRLDKINWEEEVAFKEQVPMIFRTATSKSHVTAKMTMALTGATGFLGRHILQRLIADPKVKAVHCIAVRDASKLGSMVSSPKVVIHRGDLREPHLGLSEGQARRIFSGLSAIIHNGADVSFLRGYPTIRAANLLSTKAIVQLCIKHHMADKPPPHFHFVSTAGVSQLGTSELYEESLAVPEPPSNSNGYVATKWASEKYLEHAHDRCGITVAIHRPTYVVGPDAPQLDVMHNLLHFAKILRSVPVMPPVDRWLQFVGIEEVAGDVVEDVLTLLLRNPGNVVYRNHCGVEKNWVRLDQLGPYLEQQHGGKFVAVAFEHWLDAAGQAGMPIQVKEYLGNLMVENTKDRRSWVYPRVLKGPRTGHGPWQRAGKL